MATGMGWAATPLPAEGKAEQAIMQSTLELGRSFDGSSRSAQWLAGFIIDSWSGVADAAAGIAMAA